VGCHTPFSNFLFLLLPSSGGAEGVVLLNVVKKEEGPPHPEAPNVKFFVSQAIVQVLLRLFPVLLQLFPVTKFRLAAVLFVSLDCASQVFFPPLVEKPRLVVQLICEI